ncbi:ATP:cob(I)alamin adenosyltransferase [bacterium (Candidatus Blackallbacteria) CG17_big_fil_post_rev_8_21_14_2_50_48_46]|uniref:Corrinoid adenosyltransferase n=1 Tax=bacterium (Candidatus Blackallbacteria) CG17_big_fil_post_rev_8_21_14_2_50_48_46 TaxID=2014261 RepID=A0A2M7FZQ9_9BACT|nr:MAG: ATP:cob(I)alamin adenosyltransferase [bacterium (Candidatus Blackallbacteria) CG18_big_fil_WC_8_21_14_2_50_49_26]PIW14894.1 MAG: ATP:cob(I)alamin adenosyltransferase [bacterium (Candidatus Blackallbacteria) CG17_big_fil_post_rev_8_21_14_2_50_48_46]PIW44318.1 MAG: ATP:cob(I)alamin adenosyltransferase [bacterium (Candidatus Blackallbacteria) CG13_big_fil_rev_8_21_14_2_50_49_14]
MKIYTRTGDTGETGLWGGRRVSKHDLRIQAYGSVDECNALLGLAICEAPESLKPLLIDLQNQLFVLGADLASPEASEHIPRIQAEQVSALEKAIDAAEADLPPLTQFILPGGSKAAAGLHLARTVARRAEREVVALMQAEAINPHALTWLNRLSDLLFVMARSANHLAQISDIPWQKP